jgi:hypothetical protein
MSLVALARVAYLLESGASVLVGSTIPIPRGSLVAVMLVGGVVVFNAVAGETVATLRQERERALQSSRRGV